MEFCVLGAVEVRERGVQLPLGRPRDRAVLALLILHAGKVVSVEALVEALWENEPPPTAVGSIHNSVSRLRRLLGRDVVVTQGRGYALAAEEDQIDVARFRRLIAEGTAALEEGEHARASALLDTAERLWRGLPFGDVEAPFTQLESSRLSELRVHAVEQRVEADLALGRHHSLVPELDRLIAEWPLRERLRAQLMVALYRSGRQAEALEAYARTRRHLVEELGLEPSSELQRLEQAILRHASSLERRPAATTAATAPASRRQRTQLLAAAATLVLAAGVGGYAFGARGPSDPQEHRDSATRPFGDDFADGFRGPLWRKIVHGEGIDIEEQNGRVEATIAASARNDPRTDGFDAQFSSLCTYPGNFDVQIDFELLDWPPANGVRIWLGAFYVLGDQGQWVARVSRKRGERYVALIPSAQTERATNDRRGTLRLRRQGGIMTASYRDGSTWVPLGVGPAATDETIVYFSIASTSSRFGGEAIRVAWDNFRVNFGTPTCTTGDATP